MQGHGYGEAGHGSFTTLGDPSLLHSALLNLGVNTRDAMPEGGTISFRLEHRTLAADEARQLELAPGPYLELSVTDNGTGMDGATLARIFDPFFTTKERGTGLGLAAAYGTLRAHGGSLTASALPGKGSCFSLLLPFSPPPAAALPVARPHALSVLVIDGDPVVCESTARALGRMGHRPITSAPVEALALLESGRSSWRGGEKRANDVQLVILDRDAAQVNGKDLVAGVRSLAPGVPLLLLAGYGEPAAEGSVSGTEALPVLGKPFGQKELEQAIATVRGAGLAPVTPPVGPSRSARPG